MGGTVWALWGLFQLLHLLYSLQSLQGLDGPWPRNRVTDRSRSDLDALKAILAQEIKIQGIQEIRKRYLSLYLIISLLFLKLMVAVLLCHRFQESQKAALCCGSIMTDMRNCVINYSGLWVKSSRLPSSISATIRTPLNAPLLILVAVLSSLLPIIVRLALLVVFPKNPVDYGDHGWCRLQTVNPSKPGIQWANISASKAFELSQGGEGR